MSKHNSPEPEGQLNDDLETQLLKIADQLSELSQIEQVPSGFKVVVEPFEPSDVDFESSSWLLKVLQVQVWLSPDSEIDPPTAETDPKGCAQAMMSAIGIEDAQHAVELDGNIIKLTAAGAEHLAARLDTAVRLQHVFVESLETLNRKQATSQWAEAWEEELDQEISAQDPIKAKSDTWRISDFSGKASRGLLNLNPSYQRGDVWPTSDAQKLIESILRGIPLPSIILLKPAGGKQAKYEVVDGKQRLTSILRFIGQHPSALERVKKASSRHPKEGFEKLFQSDYKKFRRKWKSVMGESLTDRTEAEYYFPFRLAQNSPALRGELSVLAGKYYCEIVSETIHVGEGAETVGDVFEKSTDYKIPLIEYLDATPKQIHEVFHLYNKQGKHLNAEEIRNALFHDVDLVRLVLVASGDNPAARVLAPYFPESEHLLLKNIAKCLSDYRFGTARYKRTKLLSWLFALLFQPSETDGELNIRSTAKQIDSFFTSIRTQSLSPTPHILADGEHLIELIRRTDACLEAHSSADCWDLRFKDDDKGQKWQELQLVASLTAVFLIGMSGRSPSEVLDSGRDEILKFTRNHQRPEKTQNKTQWAFIGEVALGILSVVGIDESGIESALTSTYGVNCLPTLRAAKGLHRSRQDL